MCDVQLIKFLIKEPIFFILNSWEGVCTYPLDNNISSPLTFIVSWTAKVTMPFLVLVIL